MTGLFNDDLLDKMLQRVVENLKEQQQNGIDVTRQIENLKNIVSEDFILDISSEYSKLLLETYLNDAPEILKQNSEIISGFKERLYNLWKKPLELLDVFITLSYEAGELYNRDIRPEAARDNNFVFEVLIRLHGRACLTAKEVLVLLINGYASGAHTRWRTLHEIATTANFIYNNGNQLAERYLLHDAVESFKIAKLNRKYAQSIGISRISDDEFEKVKSDFNTLINRFGNCFANSYGWASDVLGKCNPTFADIEKSSGLENNRPYYKLASQPVHASPKGFSFNIGLPNDPYKVGLGGPSNEGLGLPGHSTAISLQQINAHLLSIRPSFNGISIIKAFQSMVDLIGDSFREVTQIQQSPE